MRRTLLLLIFALSGAAVPVQANSLREYREVRYVMGTLLDITLYHRNPEKARKSLDGAFSLAQRLDDLLSNYKADSEVNRLNEKAGEGRVRVSPELCEFVSLAKSLSEKTGGAFDVTVGPLIELWKEARAQRVLPSPDSIAAARALVGSGHLALHSNCAIEMIPKGAKIDTGGIGKGYAVDKIVEVLRREGITRALINFGQSSIYALGAPPHAPAWKLKLQFPGQTPLGIVELTDQALSASDSLGSRFVIAGRTYGHIVDPKSGLPLSERRQAVVLSAASAEAEALSKYIVLRGWNEKNYPEVLRDVKILLISKSEGIQRSKSFPLNPK